MTPRFNPVDQQSSRGDDTPPEEVLDLEPEVFDETVRVFGVPGKVGLLGCPSRKPWDQW